MLYTNNTKKYTCIYMTILNLHWKSLIIHLLFLFIYGILPKKLWDLHHSWMVKRKIPLCTQKKKAKPKTQTSLIKMPQVLTKFCKFCKKKGKQKRTKMVSRSRVMMSFVSCHQARVYANLQRYQSILMMRMWLASQEFNKVTVRTLTQLSLSYCQ